MKKAIGGFFAVITLLASALIVFAPAQSNQNNFTTASRLVPACRLVNGNAVTASGTSTIYTCTVPANTLVAGSGIQADAWFRCSTCTATSKTWIWTFGTSTLTSGGDVGTLTTISHAQMLVFNTTTSTSSQVAIGALMFHGTAAINPGTPGTGSDNTTQAQTISFKFTGDGEVVTPLLFTVQTIHQ